MPPSAPARHDRRVRVRGVRPAPARRPPLRRGGRHRAAARRDRRVPVRGCRARLAARQRGRRLRHPRLARGLPVHREHLGLPGGRGVLPGLARPGRRGHLRRGGAARDPRAQRAQLRHRRRERRRPHGRRRRRPADRRDGLAPRHASAARWPPPGPRSSPASAPPATSRPAAPGACRPWAPPRTPSRCCTTAKRMRSARRWPPSAPIPPCSSTPTTSRAAVELAVKVAGTGLGVGAHRQRRPARAGRRRAQTAGRAGRHRHDDHRDQRPRRVRDRRPRGPPRSTPTASAPRWSPGPAPRPRGWCTSWWRGRAADGEWVSVAKTVRGEALDRRAQVSGAHPERRRHRHERGDPRRRAGCPGWRPPVARASS